MRDRILMFMTDVEHRQRLIDADDLPAFHLLGERPGDAPRASRHVEHQLAAFEREHLDQFFQSATSNARQARRSKSAA